MTDLFSVQGQAVVVAGGAGHLGRHICASLANAKADVLCLSSKKGAFNDLLSIGNTRIESDICDLNDAASVDDRVSSFARRHGAISGLVNAAGRATRGIALDTDGLKFNAQVGDVLTHYSVCCNVVTRYMETGSIVNLGSMWGVRAPDFAVYLDLKNEPAPATAAAAGAVLSLTRYLACALGARGIRVNALVPGWFPKPRGPARPDYMREISRRVPLGRIGKPSDIIGAVRFLLSGASSYVTGAMLPVDGGYLAR